MQHQHVFELINSSANYKSFLWLLASLGMKKMMLLANTATPSSLSWHTVFLLLVHAFWSEAKNTTWFLKLTLILTDRCSFFRRYSFIHSLRTLLTNSGGWFESLAYSQVEITTRIWSAGSWYRTWWLMRSKGREVY